MRQNILFFLLLLPSTFTFKAGKINWRPIVTEMLQQKPSGPLPADAQFLVTLAAEHIKFRIKENRVLKGLQRKASNSFTKKATSEGQAEESSVKPKKPQERRLQRINRPTLVNSTTRATEERK